MKKLLTAASVAALMAVPALAQDNTMPGTTTTLPKTTMTPAPSEQKHVAVETPAYAGDISADGLINKSVKNAANEQVGNINDLLIDNSGKIAAVIVGVGGFLGMGEKDIALNFNDLAFGRDENGKLVVTVKVSKESLQAAPEWKKPEGRS
jgi:hypothetical protein